MIVLAEAFARAASKKNPAGKGGAQPKETNVLQAKRVGPAGGSVNRSDLFNGPKIPGKSAPAWLAIQLTRAKREGPFTATVELTPERAEVLLAHNPDNRAFYPKSAAYIGM